MTTAWSVLPILLDGALIVAFHLAMPSLAARFRQEAASNGILVVGAYLAVCMAAVLVKRLGPAAPQEGTAKSDGL